jgi:conjugal transfer mating pair stabilization protein TraN
VSYRRRALWIALVLSLLAILLLITLYPNDVFAQAGSCRKTGAVCTQGPETRQFGGVSVARDCWQYQDTFECVDPNNVNFCAPLQANASCGQLSSVCIDTAFNGDCLKFKNNYQCTTDPGVTPSPPDLVKLADTFVITKDNLNETQCGVLAQNTRCSKVGRTCTTGPETRIINGLAVYKDCWEYTDNYSCAADAYVNFCTALSNTTQCTVTSDTCAKNAPDGSCAQRLKTYDCGVKVSNPDITLLNSSYTIVSDTLNASACNDVATSPTCALASEVCAEGAGIRNINGLDVYKDCWRYDRSYTCNGTTMVNNCGDLQAKGCTETAANCTMRLEDGTCALLQHAYQCKDGGGVTSTVTNCGGQNFCMNGNCFDTNYAPDPDFLKSTALMEAQRQGGVFMDSNNFTLFNGTAEQCKVTIAPYGELLKNCCDSKGGADSDASAMEKIGAVVVVAAELYGAGSKYTFSNLFSNTGAFATGMLVRGVTSMVSGAAFGLVTGTSTLGATAGTFSVYGVEFAYSIGATAGAGAGVGATAVTGVSYVGFDPVTFWLSIAIIAYQELTTCDQQEVLTKLKNGKGLCIYMGQWCAIKLPGGFGPSGQKHAKCGKFQQSWCCFNSKLAKIINREGRLQLGRTWATPPMTQNSPGWFYTPDCSGFNEAQLLALDFSLMDLSEFYADIEARLPDQAFRETKNQSLVQQRVQNYYNNGTQASPLPVYVGPVPPRPVPPTPVIPSGPTTNEPGG